MIFTVVIPIFVAKTPICEKKLQVTSRVDKATDEKVQAALKRLPEGTTLLVVSHRLVTGWWFKFAGNQTTAKTQRFSPQQLVGGFISFLRSTFKKCDDDHHWEQLTLLYLEVEVWISTPMTSDLRNIYLHFYRNHQIFRRKTKSFAIFFSPQLDEFSSFPHVRLVVCNWG